MRKLNNGMGAPIKKEEPAPVKKAEEPTPKKVEETKKAPVVQETPKAATSGDEKAKLDQLMSQVDKLVSDGEKE
jgi:outer membrane biosynthesis protein TonB